MTAPLLDVRGLRKFFPIAKGLLHRISGHVRAVDDVSFVVQEGEALGLVGESGCGKTTTARCILRAIRPTAGQVLYRMRDDAVVDLAPMSEAALVPLRKDIQMIFQDPFSSLNPRMTLFDNVGDSKIRAQQTLSPPCEGDGAWAREPARTGRPSKAPLHFISALCSGAQIARVVLQVRTPGRPRYAFRHGGGSQSAKVVPGRGLINAKPQPYRCEVDKGWIVGREPAPRTKSGTKR